MYYFFSRNFLSILMILFIILGFDYTIKEVVLKDLSALSMTYLYTLTVLSILLLCGVIYATEVLYQVNLKIKEEIKQIENLKAFSKPKNRDDS